jgi:hypothetical protein
MLVCWTGNLITVMLLYRNSVTSANRNVSTSSPLSSHLLSDNDQQPQLGGRIDDNDSVGTSDANVAHVNHQTNDIHL